MFKLSDFDYFLPKGLIAQYPLEDRRSCRLLVLKRGAGIEHRRFSQISEFLKQGDLLVLNDTRVLNCRLIGKKSSGGKVEVLLTCRKDGSRFGALIRPGRTKVGEKVIFNSGALSGIISSKGEISFSQRDADTVYSHGVTPLPPYIRRAAQELDKVYYQTVYAAQDGALASPTAGLHFDKEMLGELSGQGINLAYITLHVGLGTFRPVHSEDIRRHKMEPEYFCVPPATQEMIEKTRSSGGRIIAVGTTSLRALETFAGGKERGNTDLFIYPGYKFKLASCLLTNFHLPRTTLFMLVCAFCAAGACVCGEAGVELMKKAYQEAVEKEYRFYSYGDAMLIL